MKVFLPCFFLTLPLLSLHLQFLMGPPDLRAKIENRVYEIGIGPIEPFEALTIIVINHGFKIRDELEGLEIAHFLSKYSLSPEQVNEYLTIMHDNAGHYLPQFQSNFAYLLFGIGNIVAAKIEDQVRYFRLNAIVGTASLFELIAGAQLDLGKKKV